MANVGHAAPSEWDSIWTTPAWLIVFFSNLFCGCAGFAIVIPTLWPFLREMGASQTILAWAIALYSVGEGLGAVAVGRFYERFPSRPKTILMAGLVLGFCSAFCYTIAPVFGVRAGPYVVMATRLFQGFDNGGRQTIEQSFLSSSVPQRHLAKISARLGSFAITGIMVGPALGGPLLAVDFPVPGVDLRIDGNNAPGLLLCGTCLINMLVTAKYFHPEKAALQPHHAAPRLPEAAAVGAPHEWKPPSTVGIVVCYCIFFAMFTTIAAQAFLPVVAQEVFGWGPCLDPSACPFEAEQAYVNALICAGAVMSLVMALMMSFFLGEYISGREPFGISVGLVLIVLANLACVDWFGNLSPWRFVFAYLVGAFFGGFFRAPGYALFAKIIGPNPKARYMGTSFFVGAMPRVFGPFLFVRLLSWPTPLRTARFYWVYNGPMPRTYALYGTIAAMNVLVLLIVVAFRKELRPHPQLQEEGLGKPLLSDEALEEGAASFESNAYLPATPSAVQAGAEGTLDAVRSVSNRSILEAKKRSIDSITGDKP